MSEFVEESGKTKKTREPGEEEAKKNDTQEFTLTGRKGIEYSKKYSSMLSKRGIFYQKTKIIRIVPRPVTGADRRGLCRSMKTEPEGNWTLPYGNC